MRLPKEFRFDTAEVAIHREGDRIVLTPIEVERDAKGWPVAMWLISGAAPEFDVGDRTKLHERDDILSRLR